MQELGLIPEYASTTNGGSGINGDSGTESANMAGRILEKLKKVPGWLPLRTINHEEYISILELRQKEVLDQILKIDVELEKLKFAEEGLLVKQQQSSE
ncbi:hypothetical protein AX774_g2138 [Zancudomyces culisetae]|uniref:Uncharacterized protein n=1 Tax=Zancudomyces culisetae TaxID=1213189 RepID=A0A1R1PTP4_ZANCU|nr:hypothetical protein AX774_g2138 [Zancudomyces culisetae]|eukprot:OMH84338.1 hypothetical protein AX774_g2138 [Zancudomyces culisetae]